MLDILCLYFLKWKDLFFFVLIEYLWVLDCWVWNLEMGLFIIFVKWLIKG